MPVRRDYIMRMVEKLAGTFEEIVAEGDAGEREDLQRIDRALAEAFRARPETLHLQIDHGIEEIDERLAAEVGRLLELRTRVADGLGNADLSERSLRFAFRSLVQGAEMSFHDAERGDKTPLDLLRDVLRSDRTARIMPTDDIAEAWRVVFRIEAERQHFPQAEDALFLALDIGGDPIELIREGVRFYERLTDLPDQVLERRGLPRAEVDEALKELRRRLEA